MRFSAKLFSVAAFCVLSGCSSLNPFASKPDPKKLPAPLVDVKSTIAIKQLWSVAVGSAGNYVFNPAFDGSDLYVAAADGSLVRVDIANGRSVWRTNVGSSLTGGVGVGAGTVVVAGEKGNLFAFDTDGKLRWKIQESSEILSAPAIGSGMVVVRSNDNRVSAYDIVTGVKNGPMNVHCRRSCCAQFLGY